MSSVTSFVLVRATWDDEDGLRPEEKINGWFRREYGIPDMLRPVGQHGGGDKALEMRVFCGAVSVFEPDKFLAWLRSETWMWTTNGRCGEWETRDVPATNVRLLVWLDDSDVCRVATSRGRLEVF